MISLVHRKMYKVKNVYINTMHAKQCMYIKINTKKYLMEFNRCFFFRMGNIPILKYFSKY